jgi:hypothetical protein
VGATPPPPDVLEVIASMPAGTRSKTMADVYLDACCFICLVDGQPEWRSAVEKRIRDLDPASRLVTSQGVGNVVDRRSTL